ncbi:MAG: hypothetical protein IJF74_02770 [Clostridia bacterium]|nr:hypothetical protein [Clostridia bacterium]
MTEWLSTLVGATGKSAYELAKEDGFTGTLTEWLVSLVGEKGAAGATGADGKSAYELAKENGYNGTVSEWLASLVGEAGAAGAAGIDGKSAYELAKENGYSGTVSEWLASLVGETGADGKSAYEIAKDNGYTGTETEWLASLVGETGATGAAGADGKSAFELAKEAGFNGTLSEWLASLVGSNGRSAYDLAKENGFGGSLAEWLDSLIGAQGADGKSAYEIAKDKGYTGTETEWLASLAGENGEDGKSAFEIAVENGYQGTESEWLTSVKGEDGKSAFDLAVENGFGGTLTEWLASLVGAKGETGAAGAAGADGKSAYELAKENGFNGTVEEWLAGLVGETGADGKSAYEIAVEMGYQGTKPQWLASLVGSNGKSAYELAKENGYIGTLTEWLATLVGAAGADGEDGKSAYEIAVGRGYAGTEDEWLMSLIGAKGDTGAAGKSAYELAKENGFPGSLSEWLETLVGEDGIDGTNGKSAYDLAKENGYQGSITEWLASLVGAKGDTGAAGKSAYELAKDSGYQGTMAEWLASLAGENGTNGRSAFEIAKENGYQGTENEWIASLTGATGKSAYELAKDNGYSGTVTEWLLTLVGAAGADGEDGEDGRSAFEIAKANGYTGTEDEWLASLIGAKGDTGATGKSAYELAKENGFPGSLADWLESLVGEAGVNGINGKSAYELAKDNGYVGTETEWLASLVGESGIDGKSAFELAQENGYKGTLVEWLASLAGEDGRDGTDGKSAYELAVENGYEKTEQEWLASLIGAKGADGVDGADGKSAYELAVEAGYDKDINAWLASLVGATGKSAYQLALEDGFEGSLSEWLASLVGPQGAAGDDGKTAYELAVDNGFEGSLSEWLASLVGETGAPGKSAYELAIDGGFEGTLGEWFSSLIGETGPEGKSAYAVAVANGYKGTEQEWLLTLVGPAGAAGATGSAGKSAYELAVEAGFEGDLAAWLDSLIGENGADGKSAYELALEDGFKGDLAAWLDSLIGEKGADGKSAYELAVENGYDKSEQEWLASLAGEKGAAGQNGTNGKSAYELAVENGYENSEQEWLASLRGADGKSAYELAVDAGFEGDLAAWLVSLAGKKGDTGAAGKSAYELALDGGYEGTVEEWLESLAGETGDAGQSAYALAVQKGYDGTEDEWLASLIGATGKSAYQLAVENGFEGDVTEWLASLVGPAGKSAFQVAQENGYAGTEQEWIDMITGAAGSGGQQGADGKSAYELAKEQGFIGSLDEWLASLVGKTGNGIKEIELTDSKGLVDTYTVYYTDGTVFEFDITVAATWHTGNGEPIGIAGARVGDLYLNLKNADVYELGDGGWSPITNIRGISVTDVDVEALYDEKGKYFDRYTFTFSDGTLEIVDVYDSKKAYMIQDLDYYVIVADSPDTIPDIDINIINFNSNVISVPLKDYMIMNINEVHFSTLGTYRAFIQYYNVCGYVTIHIVPKEPVPNDETKLNAPDIIWSEHNFNSFIGSYLNVVWDRPSVPPVSIALDDPEVTVTKKDGSAVTESDKGEDLELAVTYKGYTTELNVHWMDDSKLKNAKVLGVKYVGNTVVLDESDITAEGVDYPDMSECGYLAFELYTDAFSGMYFRNIDMEHDKIVLIDTAEEFGLDKYITEQAVDYDMSVALEPEVTARKYNLDNTIVIFVLANGTDAPLNIEATGAFFSKNDFAMSPYSIPEVDVTFNLNMYPYTITVPLTADMMVDKDVFKTAGDNKSVELNYRYGRSTLNATVYGIFVHDLSKITQSSLPGINLSYTNERFVRISPVYDEMKCTASSEIVPVIPVTVSYVRESCRLVLGTGSVVNTYPIEVQTLYLTQSDINNIKYLNFSKPGRKEIKFPYNGAERTVYIEFYDVEIGIIKSIEYSNGVYSTSAIPSSVTLYDIGDIYLNVSDMNLYDRYTGSWEKVGELGGLVNRESVKISFKDGSEMWIMLNEDVGTMQYSTDGSAYSNFMYINANRYTPSDGSAPIAIGNTAPHNDVNKADLLFAIRNNESMQIGNTLHIVYYENVGHALVEEIVVDEAFFNNYDLSEFRGSYLGQQNVYFKYGDNYTYPITVTVEPRESRFELYTNVSGLTDDDGNTLAFYVDTERNVLGTRKSNYSNISDYLGYYVAETQSGNREIAYVTNLATAIDMFGGQTPTAEQIRFNLDYVYKRGFIKVMIDHENKTVEALDSVDYAEVDLSVVPGGNEIDAYLRLDGEFAELKLVTTDGSQVIRFFYKTYENGKVISVEDKMISEEFGTFHFVRDENSVEERYIAYVGKWGEKYSLDPAAVGFDPGEVTGLCVVLCENNELYMTYDGMLPNDVFLINYTVIDSNRIYVPTQGMLANLDRETKTAELITGEVYEADISAVPVPNVVSAYITKGLDTMLLTVTVNTDGVENTQKLEFLYFEIEENKFDVYLSENNSVSSSERELFDDYYVELVDGKLVAKADVIEKTYSIDYSDFRSFPDAVDVDSISYADLKISTKDSLMSISINGSVFYSGKYVYDSLLDTIYPAEFDDSEDLMFSFKLIDESNVKMYDLFPGDEYEVNMDIYAKLSGEDVVVQEAIGRLNERGICSFYAELLVYDSNSGKYETQIIKQVFNYKWESDGKLAISADGSYDDVEMHLQLVENRKLKLCYGSTNVERFLVTEDGLPFIFYKGGIAGCDTDFGLVDFCFYEYLDEDSVYICTFLGMGLVYDIVDEVLYLNEDYCEDSDEYELVSDSAFDSAGIKIYKKESSNKIMIKYVGEDEGNGKEVSSGYFKGETLEENLHYFSFLVFMDVLVYDFDGHTILFVSELDL